MVAGRPVGRGRFAFDLTGNPYHPPGLIDVEGYRGIANQKFSSISPRFCCEGGILCLTYLEI